MRKRLGLTDQESGLAWCHHSGEHSCSFFRNGGPCQEAKDGWTCAGANTWDHFKHKPCCTTDILKNHQDKWWFNAPVMTTESVRFCSLSSDRSHLQQGDWTVEAILSSLWSTWSSLQEEIVLCVQYKLACKERVVAGNSSTAEWRDVAQYNIDLQSPSLKLIIFQFFLWKCKVKNVKH